MCHRCWPVHTCRLHELRQGIGRRLWVPRVADDGLWRAQLGQRARGVQGIPACAEGAGCGACGVAVSGPITAVWGVLRSRVDGSDYCV